MTRRILAPPLLLLLLCFSRDAGAVTFQDVNIVATTDVHAWIAGGDRQVKAGTPALDATFGDLTSFAQRAKAAAAAQGKDLFLVDNGDVVDGTGLSNLAADHCSYLLPLLQQVPYDALNCGNHELYDNATMEAFRASGYIDGWNGRYLTSNLYNASEGEGSPLGARSAVMVGPVTGVRILTFGFMYDMAPAEGRCAAVGVTPVEEAVGAAWFTAALGDGSGYDAVLVLAHMDAFEPLIETITSAVRAGPRGAALPVLVIAGHSHARKIKSVDARCTVFEPGNYFNTVGFASFDLPSAADDAGAATAAAAAADNEGEGAAGADGDAAPAPYFFSLTDIDTSVGSLALALNLSAGGAGLHTAAGDNVTAAIRGAQAALGLSEVLGCAPQDYLEGPGLDALYVNTIVPKALFAANDPPGAAGGGGDGSSSSSSSSSQWLVQSVGGLRYDLYGGNVTTDDIYKILPFRDAIKVVHGVEGEHLRAVLQMLNGGGGGAGGEGEGAVEEAAFGWDARRARAGAPCARRGSGGTYGAKWIATDDNPQEGHPYDCYFVSFDAPKVAAALQNASGAAVVVADYAGPGPTTDTDMMIAWAKADLPPC
jgi:2',3'-cyclic-nucleotide 2'-phosphodiesterase (5'-nucleotidase family)